VWDGVEEFFDIHLHHRAAIFSLANHLMSASDRALWRFAVSISIAIRVENWLIDGGEDFRTEVLYDFILHTANRQPSHPARRFRDELFPARTRSPAAAADLCVKFLNAALNS
jgi:hypothetical protein